MVLEGVVKTISLGGLVGMVGKIIEVVSSSFEIRFPLYKIFSSSSVSMMDNTCAICRYKSIPVIVVVTLDTGMV